MNKISYLIIILLIPGCCTITGNNNSCDFTDSSSEAIDLGDEVRKPFISPDEVCSDVICYS